LNDISATITLNNGIPMPRFGLGVLHIADGSDAANAVVTAIEAGYRLIDTASIYHNEAGVGKALREAGVPREDIFLTTKVWNADQGYEPAKQAFQSSLERLGVDYVDLYLIHWPGPDPERMLDTWRALESIYAGGKARAIGLSNFQVPHLEQLLEHVEIMPAVNQVEIHPHLQQSELVEYCQENGIQVEAWRPIMKGEVMGIPEMTEIGQKYGKNPVQVTLRWLLQRDLIVIPKSENPLRIRENADIFDFELTHEEIEQIKALDQDRRLGPDPFTFALDFD
jgi:diketogulonate reductase-like aldo/keto reductase